MKQQIRKYTIESIDDKNYVLTKNNGVDKNGKPKVSKSLYYNNIAAAVTEIARREANETENLKTWLAEYRTVKNEIAELLK